MNNWILCNVKEEANACVVIYYYAGWDSHLNIFRKNVYSLEKILAASGKNAGTYQWNRSKGEINDD